MTQPKTLRTFLVYAAMLVLAALCFEMVRRSGSTLSPGGLVSGNQAMAAAASPAAHNSVLSKVLLALVTITLTARLVGTAFDKFLKQPRVMGEIVAGILLGPSVLGAISPTAQSYLLPNEIMPLLGTLAQIGVILFMFLVGLEFDPKILRGRSHSTLAISHASIVAPFTLGAVLALWLFPRYGLSGTSFTVFALFLGVSMSVTAFPVLARILSDRRLSTTALGATALACAAVDDATAWCLLAFVSGVARSEVNSAFSTLGQVVIFVGATIWGVRPLMKRLADHVEKATRNGSTEHSIDGLSLTHLTIVFSALLASAMITERIGIHALFGAFLLGVVMPHDGRLAESVRVRVEDIVISLFLPLFFAFSGARTQIGLVGSGSDWLFVGAIIAVATIGKFGGSFVAARFAGHTTREASAIGVLMNTRGLMELIVLNVGLDMGVLSPTLFAMMVIMALVTTFATTPVLQWFVGYRTFSMAPPPLGSSMEPVALSSKS